MSKNFKITHQMTSRNIKIEVDTLVELLKDKNIVNKFI